MGAMHLFKIDDRLAPYDFEYELQFTKTYQAYSRAPRSTREAACLALSFPQMLRPVEDGDLFVGRRIFPALGVSPMYWDNDTHDVDHIGYYADIDRLERMRMRAFLSPERQKQVDEMIDFWRRERSNARVRAAFDDLMNREMPTDFWDSDPGVIFCLYRLAGAQLDYDKLTKYGLPGLIGLFEARLAGPANDTEQAAFYQACVDVLKQLIRAMESYAVQLEALIPQAAGPRAAELRAMRDTLRALCLHAPETFRQAVQLVWLYSVTSGTVDFNRMDGYLGGFYCDDIDAGRMTEAEGQTLLLSFYRLLREVYARDTRVIIGGLGRPEEAKADRFAMAVMRASMTAREMQPQVTLRMYKGMSPAVRELAFDMLESGMTYPLLYNDDANIASVMKTMRIGREEAEQYCFFGCGEYVINHKSMGTPNNIINLLKALEVTLHNGVDPVSGRPMGLALGEFASFKTFDALWAAYTRQVEYFVNISARHQKLVYDVTNEQASMLMMSILTDDCLETGRAVLDGGIRHLAGTYETYGNVSTADSLTAIREAVYNRHLFSQDQLLAMLDADFEGYEKERRQLLALPKYGNDDPVADQTVKMVHDHVAHYTMAQGRKAGLDSYLIVIINNSANTVLGRKTCASADGRKAFTYMSNGNGPMAGMDRNGLTALLNSLSVIDPSITGGVAQNIKFSRTMFTRHRDQLNTILEIMRDRKMLSLNISVLDKDELEDALVHPELHQNLFVRVGGFSARFITLDKDVQQDVLKRSLY
jgi:pyruvate-formate lyase